VFGSIVFWQSKIQSKQAHETAEAELNSLVMAVREIDWLKPLVEAFGEKVHPVVLEDNQSVIGMLKEPRKNRYKLAVHYIRDCLQRNDFRTVSYIPTDKQAADILTKVINKNLDSLIRLIDRSHLSRPGMLCYWSSVNRHYLAVWQHELSSSTYS